MVVLPPPCLPLPQNPMPYTYAACPSPLGLIIMQINCLDLAVGFSFLDFFFLHLTNSLKCIKCFQSRNRGQRNEIIQAQGGTVG